MSGNEKHQKMSSELFTEHKLPEEYWIPPHSKEEYLVALTRETDSDNATKLFKRLITIFHADGANSCGKYSEEGFEELIELMKEYSRNEKLKKPLSYLALGEGCYCEKRGDYLKALEFYEFSLEYKQDDVKLHYFQINNCAFCLNY